MKKLILVMTIVTALFGCKKEDKCFKIKQILPYESEVDGKVYTKYQLVLDGRPVIGDLTSKDIAAYGYEVGKEWCYDPNKPGR